MRTKLKHTLTTKPKHTNSSHELHSLNMSQRGEGLIFSAVESGDFKSLEWLLELQKICSKLEKNGV